MTDKADPVVEIVEEEEEEWPEAGAQNVAEEGQYQDKINNVFDTPFHFNSSGHQNGPFRHYSKFQKDYHEAMGQHGGSRHGCGIENH